MFPARAPPRKIFFGKMAGATNVMTPNRLFEDWLEGRASLGAAGGWTAEEMRLVAAVGYALGEQGRHDEAGPNFWGRGGFPPPPPPLPSGLRAPPPRKGGPRRAPG